MQILNNLKLVSEATHLDIYTNENNAISYEEENLVLNEILIQSITHSNIHSISAFDKQWITQNIDILTSAIDGLTTDNIKAYCIDRNFAVNVQRNGV